MNTPLSNQNHHIEPLRSEFSGFSLLPHINQNGLKRTLCQRFQFTPVPDQFFDLLPHLSASEVKVLLYIIKRTLGFNKPQDTISHRQFLSGITTKDRRRLDYGAGVSKNSLHSSLRSLVKQGIITKATRKADNGRDLSSRYGLTFVDMPETILDERDAPSNIQENLAGGEYQKSSTYNKNFKFRKQRCRKRRRKKIRKAQVRVDYLIDQIEQVTDDTHSRGGFAQVALQLPDELIFQILSEIKQASGLRNKGAVFISLAKKYLNSGKPSIVPPREPLITPTTRLIKADEPELPEIEEEAKEPIPTVISYWELLREQKPELAETLSMNRKLRTPATHYKVIEGT